MIVKLYAKKEEELSFFCKKKEKYDNQDLILDLIHLISNPGYPNAMIYPYSSGKIEAKNTYKSEPE